MKALLVWLSIAAILTFAGSAGAEKDFSSWRKFTQAELVSENTAVPAGAVFTIGMRVQLQGGWHTYWVNPGDSGAPLRLKFKNSPGVRVRRVLMPAPQRFETGPLISFGYEKEVLFPIEMESDADLKGRRSLRVEVDAEWLVCEDVCLPAFQTLTLDLPVRPLEKVQAGSAFATFQSTRNRVPRVESNPPTYVDEGNTSLLTVKDWEKDHDFIDFFPFKGSGVSNEAPILKTTPQGLELRFNKSALARAKPDRVGVLVGRRKVDGAIDAWQFGESGWTFEQEVAETGRAAALWWMLLSAFLGGLILNLMPCVFPVLSIKLLSLMKLAAAHPREVRRQNFAYVGGVLISFLAVAFAISLLRSAGTLVGWGFQLQSPLFVSALAWLFLALSLNLLGVFEFDFVDAGLGHQLTRFGGIWGSFFTGVLAVVVASPCTAPFMGVALGFGLSQSLPVLTGIFLSLGLGLAFPYVLFAVFPAWVQHLPKPGAWMNRVKQVMAVPLLATLVWLFSILWEVRGEVAALGVAGAGIMLAVALWRPRGARAGAMFLAALAMGGALFYVEKAQRSTPRSEAAVNGFWRPFAPEVLEDLLDKKQKLFVNMTADWCLTCKVNERLVFIDPEIQELLRSKGVVALKGDWTERDERITLFLNRYNRVGVPFYVLFSDRHPEGLPLPEVLTKGSFTKFINEEFP